MALIKCSNCNHEISDTINKCIHCGAKIKKQELVSNDIQHNENEKIVKITEKVKETTKPIKTTKKEILNNTIQTQKNEKTNKNQSIKKLHKPRNIKPYLIGIATVIGIVLIAILSILGYNMLFKINSNKQSENYNNQNNNNNNNNELAFNNLRSIIAPKFSYEELISKNGDISIIIEIENGKSVKYAFDVFNDSNKDIYYNFTDNNLPTITCNNDTSYTCVDNINVGWEDNQEINLIKPHTTRTFTFEITTTGAEENGIIKIKTHKENTNNSKVYIDDVKLLVTEDCIHCQKFQAVVESFVNKYNLPLNIIDYEIQDSKNENGEILYPTLLLYKNNSLVLRHEGYVPENELIQIIKNKGLIKE